MCRHTNADVVCWTLDSRLRGNDELLGMRRYANANVVCWTLDSRLRGNDELLRGMFKTRKAWL